MSFIFLKKKTSFLRSQLANEGVAGQKELERDQWKREGRWKRGEQRQEGKGTQKMEMGRFDTEPTSSLIIPSHPIPLGLETR